MKSVFVNEKTYNEIVKQLGYEPSNLGISHFVEDKQAIVLDENAWMDMNKKLHEPIFKW